MSEQKSTNTQLNITEKKRMPADIQGEICQQADPATAIILLFTKKSLYNQDLLWQHIANRLKLEINGKIRDVCIKWLKIHRHILQIYGERDTVTINDWSSYFKRRYQYLNIEQTIRQKFPSFRIPIDYLEWLILKPLFKQHGEHHRSWAWDIWTTEPHVRTEANSLWIQVATLNDYHDMFINCDTKNKLFGCTVDCYDTELEYQSFDETWNDWLQVITRDTYMETWDEDSYRRNLFGEKIKFYC